MKKYSQLLNKELDYSQKDNSDFSGHSKSSLSDSPNRYSSPRRDSFESPSKLSAALASDNSDDSDPDVNDDLLNESPEEKYGITQKQIEPAQNQTLFTASSIIKVESDNKKNGGNKKPSKQNTKVQTKSHPIKTSQKSSNAADEVAPSNLKKDYQDTNDTNEISTPNANPPIKRTKAHFSLKRPQKKPKK